MIILTTIHLAIHIPSVQSFVAHKVISNLESKIDGKIEFRKLTISFFTRVILEDLCITGTPGDTLINAEKIAVYISPVHIIQGDLRANRISVSNGVFNYSDEGPNKQSNISRIFRLTNDKDTTKGSWPHITIRELRIHNYRFNYKDYRDPIRPVYPGCMDYTDIQTFDINLRAYDVQTRPKKGVKARIHTLKAKEKSGLVLKNLACDFTLDKNATTFKNLRLEEGFSFVKANYLTFRYRSGKDLKNFVQNMRMDVDFTDTFLDFRTIGIYAHEMQDNHLQLYLNGRVHGPVAHLQTSRLKVETPSKNTYIDLAVSIKGLPAIRNTVFDAQIHQVRSNAEETDWIISNFTNKNKPILTPFIPRGKFTLEANMLGTIYDCVADGKLNSTAGDIEFDVKSVINGKKDGSNLKGTVNVTNAALGKILKIDNLGDLTAKVKADVMIKGKEYGGLNIGLESLSIDEVGFKGYNYSKIFAVGKYSNHTFDGRIVSHDPNLKLMFQGVASLADITEKSIYNFYADIAYIDLAAINLIKTRKKAQLSLRTMANVTSKKDEMFGNVDIKNVTYWGDKEYKFNSMTLSSIFQNQSYHINLDTPFIDADFRSTEPPKNFISRLKEIILKEQFGDTFIKDTTSINVEDSIKGRSDLHIKTYDTQDIFNILMPNLYLADNTTIALHLDEKDSMDFRINSDRVAIGRNFLKDFNMVLTTPQPFIKSSISSKEMSLGSTSFYENTIDIVSKGGQISLECILDHKKENTNEISLSTNIDFERNDSSKVQTNISFNDSYIHYKGHKWDITPSLVNIAKREFQFKDFKLQNKKQYISIEGSISENIKDSIIISLNDFDLSIIDAFLTKGINLNGNLTGSISATNIYDIPGILMDVYGNGLSLKNRSLGEIHLLSKWDQNRNRMNLLVQNRLEGLNPLNISGYYQPKGKYLNVDIFLREFGLSVIEPFVKGALVNTGGVISGNVGVSGPLDKLVLNSTNTRIHNFSFTPAFTKVPYVVSGDVRMDKSGIYFDKLTVHDRYNSEGHLSGSLKHQSFKNMHLDASMNFNDLLCLNTTEKDNQTFYGSAYASGNVTLSGPFTNLFADATVSTGARTAIHIPLSSAASAKSEDLLKFASNETVVLDPYLERMKKNSKRRRGNTENSKTNFALRARANVTSDTELLIEINKQLGDVLKCRGNGTIDINLDPSKSLFDLKGDYTIEEGSYKFVLLGITAKDFTINNGGNIIFNGDIKSTTLNVGATYKTKASISTLIADTSAIGNRKDVDCGIKMSGSLSDPNVSFTVDVQDLDPITKGRVESALSTDDKVQKQFMALLLSGSFIPDEQSGIFNNSTILYSNAGEMISNQVNQVFRQLDIPLDLGFNFQPASSGSSHDMFDVALSYQAFNNRVIINGNVGNDQVSQTWGGNFEAEVKLDKRGRMRVKAFTRSPDDYTNYLDNTQRHGIGFSYQDEFNTFRELLRNIFWSKKRKEEYENQRILEVEKQLKEEQTKEE